jgi:steroid delta-isomerase-like uncharacterized protein
MTATPTMSRAEIDRLLDEHFDAEAAGDIPRIEATLTDDVYHDIIGQSVLHGREAAGARYDQIFSNLDVDRFVPVRRLYADHFVVDEVMVEGRVVGMLAGLEGRGRPVRFRLLHVFELRNGLIARETACMDEAAVQQQLA